MTSLVSDRRPFSQGRGRLEIDLNIGGCHEALGCPWCKRKSLIYPAAGGDFKICFEKLKAAIDFRLG
jgi:hypothetical protein